MASAAVATDPPSNSSARDFFMPISLSVLTNRGKCAYTRVGCNHAYMSTLEERIAEVMASTGRSISDLAAIAEVSTSAVSQWASGETKSIKLEPAIRLQNALGYSALWLANGKGAKRLTPPQEAEPEFAGRSRPVKHIPIVGTAKLGDDGFYEEISSIPGAGDGHIEIATEDPNAYGLRVRGQSMFPAIRDGWYVLVEPNGQPRTGEYVLLKLQDGRKMVKELLLQRPTSVEVMSVNGNQRLTFELAELDSIQAVGAVVSPSKWRPD